LDQVAGKFPGLGITALAGAQQHCAHCRGQRFGRGQGLGRLRCAGQQPGCHQRQLAQIFPAGGLIAVQRQRRHQHQVLAAIL
jgi:hypothetical protein